MYQRLREVQEELAQSGGKRLGNLLWWTLGGSRIKHQAILDLAAKHNLDARFLPPEVKPQQAFRRACRHLTARLPKGLMLRPIGETADEIIVGLVNEKPDAAQRDLDYTLTSRIVFDKATTQLRADAENPSFWELRDLLHHHQDLTSEDLRNMLSSFLAEAGISLRDTGGVYFIPPSFETTLNALCAVVEGAGRGNQCFVLPVVETPESKATLREVARKTLDDEVRTLESDLARFELDSVRQSTLERKLDGFEDLRSRVQMFSRVLSFRADSLNERISTIQGSLRQRLAGPTTAANQDVPIASAGARSRTDNFMAACPVAGF